MTRRGPMADPSRWLVSARFDVLVFTGPAVVALALVGLGPWLAPKGETPLPFWVVTVLFVDVAHVWSTVYRTYLDPDERRRHAGLYTVVPLVGYGVGLALAAHSWALFWTVLAYTAVFHFVRQQYGWVALYNRRDPGLGAVERSVDVAAIYAATIFPLLWWHANLPRQFHWFLPGDFIDGLGASVVFVLWPVYVGIGIAFAVLQLKRAQSDGVRWGKVLLVTTTSACWGLGIIATNSDWAFTVTNVLIHGVPYMAIVWVYGQRDAPRYRVGAWQRWMFGTTAGAAAFLVTLGIVAYAEEWGWDRLVWHGETSLFLGPTVDVGRWMFAVLPLLAVPQVTHYILDGFIWRRSFRVADAGRHDRTDS